jgi:hypothetical protein
VHNAAWLDHISKLQQLRIKTKKLNHAPYRATLTKNHAIDIITKIWYYLKSISCSHSLDKKIMRLPQKIWRKGVKRVLQEKN